MENKNKKYNNTVLGTGWQMSDIPYCCAAIASALNLQVEGIQGTPVRKSVQASWL